MSNNIKIKSEKTLSDNFIPLKEFSYEYEKDGKAIELKREVYMSKNGVAALLYNRETNKVILIKQFRLPSYLNNNPDGILLEACAGLLDKNENPADAMLREIEEETGYKVKGVKKIFEMYMTPGAVAEMLHFFIAEYTAADKKGAGGGLAEENEEIEVVEMPFQEAFDKIQSGGIKDAKTTLLLQYAKLYLFEGEKVFEVI